GSSLSSLADYLYDGNGNAARDGRNNKTITYNYLNLPATVNGTEIVYTYDAAGNKLRKASSTTGTTDYVGGIHYGTVSGNYVINFIQTEEGRAVRQSDNSYKYEYNLTDHLGNVRKSFDIYAGTARVIQTDDYYPFGMQKAGTVPGNASKYLYNGKEVQEELGTYDYGWRQYDPVVGRWMVPDPLAEKYYSLSPYNYAANNPINIIDLDGRDIDPASRKEWDKQKNSIIGQRDKVQGDINKTTAKAQKEGWSAEKLAGKLGNLSDRLASLNGSIGTLGTLEGSTQMYSLKTGAGEEGGTTYDPKTGNVVFSFGSTSNFLHEITHGGQFETGDFAFSSTGQALGQDVGDEVAAYKAQFAFDPSSVSALTSSSSATSFGGITSAWVQGITKSDGSKPYGLGGAANTGLVPVNINSNLGTLMQAYPNAAGALRGLPANTTLRSIPGIYIKH
ncbi:RHS repeat domain-containing protein, partial [Hufsiella ginkgonis]